jgi:carbonic anhydrase
MRRVPHDETFSDVLAAADAYAESFDLAGLEATPTRGLAVLTCMDARIDPLRIFGLRAGEAAVLRNGGARIDGGMLAALAIARDRLDVTRLLVLGHTDCRGTVDARETVAADVTRLDTDELLPGIAVGGYVYDVATGRITSVG